MNGTSDDPGGWRLRTAMLPLLLVLVFPLLATVGMVSCGGDDSDSNQAEESTVSDTQTATTGEDAGAGVDLTALPLGDGLISTSPRTDYVYSCQTEFNDNAGGALADGPWIDDENGTWNAKKKISVPGQIKLDSEFDVSIEGDTRKISGNNFPTEPVGEFPVPTDSEAYQYDPNPNEITEQAYELELPKEPKEADSASCLSLGAIGVMLDGSYFFNALDGPGRDAVAHEIQDGCDGHPERSGAYHYHSLSTCIEDPEGEGHSALVGYAIDGFGIYGHHGEDGQTLTNADLDQCHGHTHEIEWDGESTELYHYHATFEYPYTLGCYRGEPSEDAELGAATGSGEGDGPPGGAGPPGS